MITHLVVMGVSGTGKSSVAHALEERLGWRFAEGDDLHPASNLAKMAAGVPLEDADRWPWLDAIGAWMSAQDREGLATIVTCSALRRAYRDRLRDAASGIVFAHLVGTPALLETRLQGRSGHFMPASLLPSQLAALEPLQEDEPGFEVSIDAPLATVANQVIAHLEQDHP